MIQYNYYEPWPAGEIVIFGNLGFCRIHYPKTDEYRIKMAVLIGRADLTKPASKTDVKKGFVKRGEEKKR